MSQRKPKPHRWQCYTGSTNKGALFIVLLPRRCACKCLRMYVTWSSSVSHDEEYPVSQYYMLIGT